jgi:hypothetical protein
MFKQKLKIKGDCSKELWDTTGFYSSTNTEGWGTPNITRASIDSAILKIKFEDTVEEYDITETIQDSVFNEIKLYSFEDLLDGIYEVTVTITEGEDVYETKITFTSLCKVKCCVDKLAAKHDCNCGCEDNHSDFETAYLLLKSLESMLVCLGEYNFNKQLKRLQKICNNSDCNCK